MKRKPWNYLDPSINVSHTPHRTCSSPVDDFEVMQNQEDEDKSATHSVEVQTDRSTLFSLKQSIRKSDDSNQNCDIESTGKKSILHETDPKLYQVNEFECVRLKKTGFNYEYDKLEAKLTVNMNTPEVLDESDVDQPMDFALCYSETDVEETQKSSLSSIKNVQQDKTDTGKSKFPFSKETTKNKKEMFTNPSKSFKEIFNFFKDRDKKKSNESTKALLNDASKKREKVSIVQEQKAEKPQPVVEQCEKETKSKAEASCSQETPLMFSRCSSLSSLSGIEHISVYDDRSSILSDFSRRTSGVVSPSELPDSPAQSVSASSRPQQKSHVGCFGKKRSQSSPQQKIFPGLSTDNSNPIHESNLRKPFINKYSVFEDNLTQFKDESTPTILHSMAASSLSSLTIDDDYDEDFVNKIILNKENESNDEKLELNVNRQEPSGESNDLTDSSPKSEPTNTPYQEQKENVSEEEEDDELTDLTPYEEQLLDQCIRRGIAKWTNQNLNEIDPFSWDLGLTCRATKAIMTSKIRNNSYVDYENNFDKNDNIFINQETLYDNLAFNRHFQDNSEECEDYQTYLDEDLSINEQLDQGENETNQNSSYVTYQEQLLDQCIRRGMAKITKRNINDLRPFSWDINQICLTTRVGFPNRLENICYSY